MNEPEIITYKGKIYWGYKSPCPTWLKNKYREAVNHICQDCKQHETNVGKLEPHRIKRGCESGLYVVVPLNHPLSNVKMVCKGCHKKYNYSRKIDYSMEISKKNKKV